MTPNLQSSQTIQLAAFPGEGHLPPRLSDRFRRLVRSCPTPHTTPFDEGNQRMTAPTYEVTLNTRDGRRVLTAGAEREAALMAESVMRLYEGETLRVGFAVACPDPDARRRIAFYLTDLALELDLA